MQKKQFQLLNSMLQTLMNNQEIDAFHVMKVDESIFKILTILSVNIL